MEKVKTLILGGGISAISYAHFSQDEDYLIIEKEDRLGGLCRSFKVGESIFDFSGHFMHFKDEKMREYVESLLKKHQTGEFNTYKREAGILIEDDYEQKHLIDYPFQANIHQLPKDDFIECLVDLWEAQKTRASLHPKNFYDLAVQTFGHKITKMFFRPYNEKLYRTKLKDMDADAMGRFIPTVDFNEVMQNIKERKNFGYNSTFLYSPTSGIQGVVDAFVAEKPLKFSLNETIVSIDGATKTVVTDKRTITYDKLINTLPLPTFAKLAGLPPLGLKYVDVDVYNITFDGDVSLLRPKAWIYFPGRTSFYRVGFYNFMSGKPDTSVYVEVSRDGGRNGSYATMSTMIEELKSSGVIRKDATVKDSQFLTMSPAYAIIEPKTEMTVEMLRRNLNSNDIHITGRYGKWTYQSIEDNILDAKALAESFN